MKLVSNSLKPPVPVSIHVQPTVRHSWASPCEPASASASSSTKSSSRLQHLVQRAYQSWPDDLAGKFSITRLVAFEEYRKTHCVWWMILVILATPVPSAMVTISLNFLPIANPLDGWQANYMLFVRTFLLGMIAGQCVKIKREFYFMDKQVTVTKTYSVRIAFAVLMTAALLLLSVTVKFPMPFGFLAAIFIASPSIYAGVRLFVTKTRTQISAKSRRRSSTMLATQAEAASLKDFDHDVKGYARMMMLHVVLFFLFPLFQVGYNKLADHRYLQFQYFLLLPLIRKVLTVWHRNSCSRVPDLSNEIVVFSVKFFVTVFKALFITSMTDIGIGFVVLWDWVELVHALAKISRLVHKIQASLRILNRERAFTSHELSPGNVDVVTECASLVAENRYLVHSMAKEMQFRETGTFGVSFYQAKTISKLIPFMRSGVQTTTPVVPILPAAFPSQSNTNGISVLDKEQQDAKRMAIEQQQLQMLDLTLKALNGLEFIVMTEFVESFFPYWLVAYIYFSSKSPCGIYLQKTSQVLQNKDKADDKLNAVLWYGLIEIANSVVLDRTAKWLFKFDLLQLLAFVLETHFANIQAKMIFFLTVVVNFHLVHYGMDFEFKFDLSAYKPQNTALGAISNSSSELG